MITINFAFAWVGLIHTNVKLHYTFYINRMVHTSTCKKGKHGNFMDFFKNNCRHSGLTIRCFADSP